MFDRRRLGADPRGWTSDERRIGSEKSEIAKQVGEPLSPQRTPSSLLTSALHISSSHPHPAGPTTCRKVQFAKIIAHVLDRTMSTDQTPVVAPEHPAGLLALNVESLTFGYSQIAAPDGPPVLHNVNLNLERGSRCILVGANGAGTSFCFWE